VLRKWLQRRRAVQRAEGVLRRLLTDNERAQLRRTGFLEVQSRLSPGRKYRIPVGASPVAALEPDGRVVYLCLQPETNVPPNELVLLHKLMLEGAEADYLERANQVGRAMGRGFGRRLL
jgi:hypothetical protein